MPGLPGHLRALAEWLLVTLTCAALAFGVAHFGWLWRIDQAIYDVSMASARGEADSDVLIVAIDERSLAELGRWPWPRSIHAELLQRLRAAGSGPVAMDILFSEPGVMDPEGDAALAAAIRDHGRVVLPVSRSSTPGPARERDGGPVFASSAAALGHAEVEFDPDGIVRSVYLWDGPADDAQPQLGLALLELSDPAIAAGYRRDRQAGRGALRTGWLRIPFVGPPGAYQRVSYVDVLKGRVAPDIIRERAVLVGAVAAGMGDMVPTPTSAFTVPMPGVEVNANVYSALRHGNAVRPAPPVGAGLVAAVVVVLLMSAVIRLTARESLLIAYGICACTLGGSWLLLNQFQIWVPPAGAVAGCILAYPLWSWRRLEAAQHYLDEELAALQREASRWRPSPSVDVASAPDPIYGRLRILRETASRQRQLRHFMIDTLDGLPTGVLVIDPGGQIQLHNRRAAALLEAGSGDEMLAKLRRIDWPSELVLRDGVPWAGGEPASIEVQAPDGRNLHVTVAALHDRRGRIHGVVLTLDDISLLKEAQTRREAAMHYLSHDLRAPIASIMTLVENHAHGGASAGDLGTTLERIDMYARSALELTENLFRLVRAEGVDARRFTVHDLSQIADDAAEEAWALARAKDIRIIREGLGEAEHPVLCEPAMLKRAVLNLLTNAVKYSPEGSAIRIRIEGEPRGWRLEVHDQGEGIRAEDRSQLFKQFGRIEPVSGRRAAGLGLGLMIVKTVVERHGGSVDVISEPGAGSVFSLHLPSPRP